MGRVSCDVESWVSQSSSIQENPEIESVENQPRFSWTIHGDEDRSRMRSDSLGKKKKNQVLLEGYVDAADEELTRTKSLTDDDLDELKGCLDLGFGFSYDEIPELCNTLPALELCYSMSQKFMDEHQKSSESSSEVSSATDSCSPLSNSIANWRISSPGDNPDDVKARLKFWAQAVACTVKLCS
ncbi:hypothetical protein L6164_013436 [Bauhinia variegata]|uniref:Uncharacterized protein n=1 Tax=Bauhinia variegata TaxID=167791 RepID=A0ACB9NEF0_BAUVA|nr:hypothetical protein L6164_013436 [Bauhinia variegata]